MKFVPAVTTKITVSDAISAMLVALREELQGEPSLDTLRLAVAQCCVETGDFAKMRNNNWGNIKAMGSYDGEYTCFKLNERLPGRGVVWFSPEGELDKEGNVVGERFSVPTVPTEGVFGHPQTRMRSFPVPSQGALDYVRLISRKPRYKAAWAALLAGNAKEFVHELGKAGYFTAHETGYLNGMNIRLGWHGTKIERAYNARKA